MSHPSGYHTCFISWRFLVQISAQKPAIQTEDKIRPTNSFHILSIQIFIDGGKNNMSGRSMAFQHNRSNCVMKIKY
jgi:hypothetical protein